MTVVAIGCALASAVFAALGAFLQHSGVRQVSVDGSLRLRTLPLLIRERTWLLGVLAHVGTAAAQITAIALAPLVVVQPIVVLSLPLVALFGARASGRKLGSLAITGIAATAGGLAVFVALTARTAVATEVSTEQTLLAGEVVAAFALVLVGFGASRTGRARCLAFAVAAGALYGLVSVLIRRVTQAVMVMEQPGIPWFSGLALAAAFLAGSWLIQVAYASGPADLVVACGTALNPITAILIGASVLGETAGIGAGVTMTLAVCGGVVVFGVALLAHSHAAAFVAPPAEPETSSNALGRANSAPRR
ncbi:hypothetical protein [Haloechinothrix salitolerans]|uniref:Magnesium transporter NIPA n=1 Tax=Haloechinothrix salitolerans TaxID=926830 RepID=A0ABW2C2T8_9PSEU